MRQTRVHVTRKIAGQTVHLVETDQHLLVFDDQGTEIMKHRWPRPGVKYVSSVGPEDGNPKPSVTALYRDVGVLVVERCFLAVDLASALNGQQGFRAKCESRDLRRQD